MPWTAAIAAGGAILGGVLSSQGSKSAANTQAGAANAATDLERQMFEQGRTDLMPWQQAGGASLKELMWEMGLDPNSVGGGATAAGGAPGQTATAPGQPAPTAPIPLAPGLSSGGGGGGFMQMLGGGGLLGNILTGDVPGGVGLRNIAAGNFMPSTQFGVQGSQPLSGTSPAAPAAPAPSAPFVGDPATKGQLVKPFDLNSFQADPGYQFRLQQGQDAINAAAAARGNFMSPGTLKELSTFSQDTASDEFSNAYNRYNQNLSNIYSRLTGLSGSGENAAGRIAGLGAGFGSQAGENTIGAGNALAAGQIGQASALNQGVGNFLNYDILSRMLQQQQPNTSFGGFTGSVAPDPTAGFNFTY